MTDYNEYLDAIINQMLDYSEMNFTNVIPVKDEDDVDELIKTVAVGVNFLGEELEQQFKEIKKNEATIINTLKEKERLLQEKEILLREIHHRVKNNLQVLSAVLQFMRNDKESAKTPEQILSELDIRVRAMASIQELIYDHKDFVNMDFKTYCIDLCGMVSSIYARGQDVMMEYDMESDLHVDFEQARHIGSFVNEAIMNSYKHQFAYPSGGMIWVSLKTTGTSYILEIKDNGENKPGIAGKNSFGQKLLKAFSVQLKGTLEINSENGYSVKLTFPKKEKKP